MLTAVLIIIPKLEITHITINNRMDDHNTFIQWDTDGHENELELHTSN